MKNLLKKIALTLTLLLSLNTITVFAETNNNSNSKTSKTFDMILDSPIQPRLTFYGVSGSSTLDCMRSANSISWGVRLNKGIASFSGTISVSAQGTGYYSDIFPVVGTSGVLELPYLPSGTYKAKITGVAVGLDGNKYKTVDNAELYFYR